MPATSPGVSTGYVPGFEVDVFISYAHVDNAAPTEDWITRLHQQLEGRLNQLLGVNNAHVWRDKRLSGAPYVFEEELQRRIASSAVFLSVLSRRYLNSESCANEVRWFKEFTRANGGLHVDCMSRMISVVKTPPREADLKNLDNSVLRVPFFRGGLDDIQEYAAGSPEFTSTCLNVAGQVCAVLEKMRHLQESRVQTENSRTVFVAETTREMQDARKQICSELVARGHRVLPESDLPAGCKDELNQSLEGTLPSCEFSVHLFGRRYGSVPEGEESRSVTCLQYEWVQENCGEDFQQLVWIPEDLQDAEPKQQSFLRAMEAAAGGQPACRTEIFKTGLASFKEGLLDILSKKVERPSGQTPVGVKSKSVYLICEHRDLDSTDFQQIRAYLLSQGYPVDLPVFEGDPGELREAEMMSLSDNDAAVIYYGNAHDSWVKAKRLTIRQALKQLGRAATRAVYLSSPEKQMKKIEYSVPDGRLPEKGPIPPLLVLGDCGPFEAYKLRPLLEELDSQPA